MHKLSFKLAIILNFLYCTSFISGRTVHRCEDEFPQMVNTFLEELSSSYEMGDTLQKARENLKKTVFDTWNETEKSAALIINIFTSSDIISVEPEMTFYKILQNQLRSGHPDQIWKQCEYLLNCALQIIGVETFDHLYRGEWEWSATFPDEGQTYFVRSFWSTTVEPIITRHFGGDKDFFYHILGAKGVRIEHISVINNEKEVLIPSARSYKVVRVLRNVTDIRKELNRISNLNSGTDLSMLRPKVLIVLAEETYYNRMNITTKGTIEYDATSSKTNLVLPEPSRGHKSFKDIKLALCLIFFIPVLGRT